MRINLRLPILGSTNINAGGNVQGDEMVAIAWAKYLIRHTDIYSVTLGNSYWKGESTKEGNIYNIYFNPWMVPDAPGINILYFQNAFPPAAFPGGSVGVYNQYCHKFDAFIYPSDILNQACKPGVVVPFAVDPEIFNPKPPELRYAHQAVFVGNNIRGPVVNARYLKPLIDKLVIYGNPDGWAGEYSGCCHGKLPMDDEPILYSSAQICINAHIDEHVTFDTINFRIFTILACSGFVITDRTKTLESEFSDCVVFTDGDDDIREKVDYFLRHQDETLKYRQAGHDLVMTKHTFKHRINDLVKFLQGF